MNEFFEYAFIVSLFVVFASLASIAALAYNKHFSPEARMLRGRLKQISELRKSEGMIGMDAAAKSGPSGAIAELIEKIAKSSRLNTLIVSSGIKARPIDVIVIAFLLGLVGLLFAFFTPRGLLGWFLSLALPPLFASVPIWVLKFKAKKRCKKFDEKFPEALGLMARALQAGSGLTTSLGMAASELPDPCGTEFKKAFDEINFGISFNEAISNMAMRVNSQDLNFFVAALVIQRETGGNLAELLHGLGHTIRERQKLARKVRIISAEGRLSGNVLISLPFAMVGILTFVNPGYVDLLWSTEIGQNSVYAGLTMMSIGALMIQRIVDIKV